MRARTLGVHTGHNDVASIMCYKVELKSEDRLTPAVESALEKAYRIRLGHDILFYLAGALTGVDDVTKNRYAQVSELIKNCQQPGRRMFGYAPHLHGTDPVEHPDVTPAEVRDIDYLFAAVVPDAHINFLAPMAHGNAIEEGWAEMRQIPSLYVVPEGVTLSRLVRGMHNIVDTIVYKNFEHDALPQIDNFLNGIQVPSITT